jgi:(R,R)-butanediol dehydrogenase / meso-butanediol dehydrogenase / diacetyl reductase
MRAAVYHGRRDVRVGPVSEPPQPAPGEILLRVRRAGICGTDAHEYLHGPVLVPLRERHRASGHLGPTILGHEFAGQIVDVGPGVDRFGVGDRVVPGAGVWCGRCDWCRAGRTNLCMTYYTLGLHANGGLAEYALVPERMCYPVPAACSDDAAGLAQPMAIAFHSVRRARVSPGQVVVVVGAGGIGAFIILAALALGAAEVVAVDVDETRLRTASALGAAHTIYARGQDPTQTIALLTGGQGAHVVIEASGAPEGPSMALASVRRGGLVLIVGLQAERRPIDLLDLAMREVELTSTWAHVCDVDLPQALAVLAARDPAPLVVERVVPLERLVADGLVPLAEHRTHGKILVDPTAYG